MTPAAVGRGERLTREQAFEEIKRWVLSYPVPAMGTDAASLLGMVQRFAAALPPDAGGEDGERLDALVAEMAKQAALGHPRFCVGVHGEEHEWVEWTEAFATLRAALPHGGKLLDVVERASDILRGGPTAGDAQVPIAQRVHDAANLLDAARRSATERKGGGNHG